MPTECYEVGTGKLGSGEVVSTGSLPTKGRAWPLIKLELQWRDLPRATWAAKLAGYWKTGTWATEVQISADLILP